MFKSTLVSLLACAALCAVSALAEDSPNTASQPHSVAALGALHEYEKAHKDAENIYRTACLAAEHRLLDKLKVALVTATKSGSLPEANAIDAQIRAANARIDKLRLPTDQKVSLRFSDSGMGYSVGELRIGAFITNLKDRSITELSPALAGKFFTQMVAKKRAPVRFVFVTAGKIYLLAPDWAEYSQDQASLAKVAHEEADLEVKTNTIKYHVWSVTGDAGQKVDIPFNVALVADSLEKSMQTK